MRRSILSLIIGICVAVVLLWALSQRSGRRVVRAAGFSPYTGSVSILTFTSASDVVPSRWEIRTIAVRGDGSTVELFHRDPINSASPMKIIKDVTARQSIHVVPFVKAKATYRISSGELANLTSPQSCSGVSNQTMLGYDVIKTTDTQTGAKGSGVDEIQFVRWRAPKLNCLPLRTEITVFQNGQAANRTVASYAQIAEGEPDPQLFNVSSDFQEKPPSEIMTSGSQMYPDVPALHVNPTCNMKPLDDVYAKQHPGNK